MQALPFLGIYGNSPVAPPPNPYAAYQPPYQMPQGSSGIFSPFGDLMARFDRLVNGNPATPGLPYPYIYGPYAMPIQHHTPTTRTASRRGAAAQPQQ